MRYKVAIVDDEPKSSELIKQYLDRYVEKNDVRFDIFEYADGDEILNDYIGDLDILFLDVEMKIMNGMETAEAIRKFDKNVIIIFITNMAHYAIKGYSVDALSYLLKPVPYFAFSQELKKSIDKIENKRESYVLVNTDFEIRRISTREIYYIEVIKHTIIIHTVDGDFSMRGTMKDMEDKLSNYHFVRNNNCYLVNLNMVKSIEKECVVVGNDKLKFSRSRKKIFIDALTSYVGRTI